MKCTTLAGHKYLSIYGCCVCKKRLTICWFLQVAVMRLFAAASNGNNRSPPCCLAMLAKWSHKAFPKKTPPCAGPFYYWCHWCIPYLKLPFMCWIFDSLTFPAANGNTWDSESLVFIQPQHQHLQAGWCRHNIGRRTKLLVRASLETTMRKIKSEL